MLSDDLRGLAHELTAFAEDVGQLTYRDCHTVAAILNRYAEAAAALERQTVPVSSRQCAAQGRAAIHLAVDNTAARPASSQGGAA